MRMIELTDLMAERTTVVHVLEVGDTIRGWYNAEPCAPAEDEALIDELAAALAAQDHETARDLAAELAVGFDEVQPATGH